MGQAAGREGARPRGTCGRASERRGREAPKLCARPSGRRDAGATGFGRHPRAPRGLLCATAWAALSSAGWRPIGPAGVPLPRQVPARPGDGVEPGRGAGWRARRGRAGRARQARRPRRHVPPAGRAAPRAPRAGDMAATARLLPPIVPGAGLGPRAASPADGPPRPRSPDRGPARGTKDGRRVRSLAPPGPRRRSSRSRPGAGGRGDSARPALTCRPLAAARGPAGPLVRHVLLPARAP